MNHFSRKIPFFLLMSFCLASGVFAVSKGIDLRLKHPRHDTDGSKTPVNISKVKNFIHVPIVDQGTDYTCGVAALQSVLYFYDPDEDYNEASLAKTLNSDPENGTVTKNMADFAVSRRYKVERMYNMSLEQLQDLIRRGIPVIVLLQAWVNDPTEWKTAWDDGHFAVVNGFDDVNIYFMDPSMTGNYAYIPIQEFLDRWHDVDGVERVYNFGMIATKSRSSFDRNEALLME